MVRTVEKQPRELQNGTIYMIIAMVYSWRTGKLALDCIFSKSAHEKCIVVC